MSIVLNNLFDTTKPFIEELVRVSEKDEITDHMFEQACAEYELDEDEAMEIMINSEEYEFIRLGNGWTFRKK